MRDMEQRSRLGGGNQASWSEIPSAQRAMVPYQAPSSDVRNDRGSESSGGGYAGGYGGSYGGSGGYGGYRRPWYPDDANSKVERMWSWMTEEIEERQRIKKEKEEIKRKEEEEKKSKEEEEKRVADQKDKEEFKASIGKAVEAQMRVVCEEVLGRKVGQGKQPVVSVTTEIRRRAIDIDAKGKKIAEMESIRTKDEEIAKLKRTIADMQRLSCQSQGVQHDQELNALRLDNQHLIQDIISLKEQVGELVRITKTCGSASAAVPVVVREKGKAVCTLTAGDYAKLPDAYRKVRDDKDLAEREVLTVKERINRIGASMRTPTSVKRKRVTRKSISPPSNLRIRLTKASSPTKAGGSGSKGRGGVKFVKLKDETRDDFGKRVCAELSKLKKKEIELLCAEESLSYVTIRESTADIAEVYADRAFGKVSKDDHGSKTWDPLMSWSVVVIVVRKKMMQLPTARVCHRALVIYAI
ncbi:hypothetical protein CBR_g24259 [Chara braunii]|uniref:Uncharacterized protein n=1 Tax=Chara braunii TaxID=69332 RepID=A0A388JM85_CHABU|nr:hypothetical protein CBR_g24259 [Chara braunii]|eukprot:GBG58908.1 hypothetical protein CBR_g24259 [Chara braunii]